MISPSGDESELTEQEQQVVEVVRQTVSDLESILERLRNFVTDGDDGR